jgi:hypothetical protein
LVFVFQPLSFVLELANINEGHAPGTPGREGTVMAKGTAVAVAPGKKAERLPKKSMGRKATSKSRQAELISALNAHTEALHRFSSALESVQPFVASDEGTLTKDDILKVLAVFFRKPDLTRDTKLSVISAGAFATRANQINNIRAFNLRGLRLSPNDLDTLASVGDLVDLIKGKLG